MIKWVTARLATSSTSALTQFQVLRYLSFIVIGILLAKFGISKSTIGRYETFVMLSSMASFFWVSGIIQTFIADFSKHDHAHQKSLLFNVFIALQTIAFIAFALVALPVLILKLKSTPVNLDTGIVLGVAVYTLITAPTFLAEYILLLQKKFRALTYYGVALFGATIIVICGVLIAHYQAYIPSAWLIPVIIAASLCISFVRYVYLVKLLYAHSTPLLNTALLKRVIIQSLPLAGSIAISGSSEYIDAFLVKHFMTDADFAIFRYGAKELPVLLIVANSFSTAMLSGLAADINTGLITLKEKSARLMHIFFPMSIVLMMVSPFAYSIVFSPAFKESAYIFNIYLLLAIPRLVFPQAICIAQQQSKYILGSSLIEIGCNLFFSILLYRYMGLAGIAAGTFISYTADKLFLILVNQRISGIRPSSYIPFKVFVVYSVLLLGVFCLLSSLNRLM